MKWLVQKNIQENKYAGFIEQLDRFGCDYTLVNVFAFVDKIFPEHVTVHEHETAEEIELDLSVPTVVVGSVRLGRLAQMRGITPGSFHNDNFDFRKWSVGFGLENILNGDAVVDTIENIQNPFPDNEIFVRPILDNKAFTGAVMQRDFFEAFRNDVCHKSEEESPRLNRSTLISIATVKEIYAEYRFFVVDSRIVTASMYKRGESVIHLSDTDSNAEHFLNQYLDTLALYTKTKGKWNTRIQWLPAEAFVIDIATTPNGPKIIEINAFGGSGFYASDPQKIIQAIEEKFATT